MTVYALGYQDYTFEFDATATNIVTPTDPSTIDTTALKAALEKVKLSIRMIIQRNPGRK